jgi:hypothetical protein
LFFVLSGSLQVLTGDDIVTAGEGDFLVVPPKMPHAFGASLGSDADVLIVITPGVERFEYFRLLDRVRKGTATPQEILDSQERFDNRFLDSPEWRAARAPLTPALDCGARGGNVRGTDRVRLACRRVRRVARSGESRVGEVA